MDIKLNKQWRIRTLDDKNLVVEKYKETKTKREYKNLERGAVVKGWRVEGYFSHIDQALNFILRKKLIANNKIKKLTDVIDEIKAFKEEVLKILK